MTTTPRCVLCGRPEDEATPSFSWYLSSVGASRCPECGGAQGVDVEGLRAENERLRECNDAMREPMRKLREALDMSAQGEGYVIDFAIRDLARLNTHVADLHRRFNTLGEERDEALRLLATRVEAKRLDEAQEEIKRLREACTLALNVMEQKNRVNVPPFAKFITVEFAPEDIAVLREALEKKP